MLSAVGCVGAVGFRGDSGRKTSMTHQIENWCEVMFPPAPISSSDNHTSYHTKWSIFEN